MVPFHVSALESRDFELGRLFTFYKFQIAIVLDVIENCKGPVINRHLVCSSKILTGTFHLQN